MQVCAESGLPIDEVWKQAGEVIDEMSHNLRIGAIRGFAMFLTKVLKALFKRIYVNTEGIQKVITLHNIHLYVNTDGIQKLGPK